MLCLALQGFYCTEIINFVISVWGAAPLAVLIAIHGRFGDNNCCHQPYERFKNINTRSQKSPYRG